MSTRAWARSRAGCKNLTLEERRKIENYHKLGFSSYKIASILERSPATIQAEIKRGKCELITNGETFEKEMIYDYYYSHEQAKKRIMNQGSSARLKPGQWQINILINILREGYSPYAALVVAKRRKQLVTPISPRTFYSYINSGKYGICHEDLMRPGVAEARRKTDEKNKVREAKHRPAELSIDRRPKAVFRRKTFGDWEGDLIVPPIKMGREVLFTLCERKTRYLITYKLPSKEKKHIIAALDHIESTYGKYFADVFRSITFDNGSEFLDHEAMMRSIHEGRASPRFQIYYAHPFRSGERGSNENINGFLRRYFPKGKDFSDVTEEYLLDRAAFINNYPRKKLKGKSSDELFIKEVRRAIARHDVLDMKVPSTVVA